MRIWYLTHLDDSPSNARLELAAHRAGVTWERVDTRSSILREKRPAPDAYFTRLGASAPASCLTMLRSLEQIGVPGMNGSAAIGIARDKAATTRVLAGAGIPQPLTYVVEDASEIPLALTEIPGPQRVLKLPVSTQGCGVELAHDDETCLEIGTRMLEQAGSLLVQQFIADSAGTDLRLFVIGGRARVAMRRRAAAGEFRSNLHRGGSGEAVDVAPTVTAIAERAAAAAGLGIAGVDVLESARGPLVIELNAAPGLDGITRATGLDVAELIVAQLREFAR